MPIPATASELQKMPTLIVKVDLECCRCSAKIQKVLSSIQDRGEFPVERIVYEEGKGRVLVSGPFDADKLCCKLWCKAGKVIKDIDVAKADPKPEPCKLVPYPYPYPYPYPQYPSTSWPCSCPTPYCDCHTKPPAPGPAPPRPPTCQCRAWPSCYCSSYPPYQVPMAMPCTPLVVCEESPPYGACAVM